MQERRLYPRSRVNWKGHATLDEGPQLSTRVLDVSAGGALLEVYTREKPRMHELVEVTAIRKGLWPFLPIRQVNALGRVARINVGRDDEHIEVGVRFHTPLRQGEQPSRMLRFPRELAMNADLCPGA